MNALRVNATESEMKAYFEHVCRLVDEGEEYPVNLDEVWPLVYSEKGKAVRALTDNFMEGVDYKVFTQNGKNLNGGRPTNEYHLTASCLEYFIARKVRAVFEVYRRVFHGARKQLTAIQPMTQIQMIAAQAQAMVEMEQRQMLMEYNQKLIAEKVDELEMRTRDNGFMSVMGFANIHHLNIGKKAAQAIGRLASKWCKRNGRTPEKTSHERWGTINTYPTAALKECFAEFYPNIEF